MLSAADTLYCLVVKLKINELEMIQKGHHRSCFKYCLLERTEEKHNNRRFKAVI
jgi:hypothetical protein